jgi:hypothetical protein
MFKISDGFNVKKFHCFVCKTTFKSNISLKRHQAEGHQRAAAYQSFGPVSMSDKPYSCVWCETKFAFAEQVNLHTRSAHGFNCASCMKIIDGWKDYLSHTQHCKLARDNIEFHQKKQLLNPKKV